MLKIRRSARWRKHHANLARCRRGNIGNRGTNWYFADPLTTVRPLVNHHKRWILAGERMTEEWQKKNRSWQGGGD